MRAALVWLCLLLCVPAGSGAASDRFDVVVIDAGHGGEDRGARGPGGLTEKALVLDVSKRLAERLRGRGLRVVLTREEDRTLSLEQRTSIANDARADLFLSIHANSARTRSAQGVEIYFVSLEASDEQARRVAERENESFRGAGPPASVGPDPLLDILSDLIATEHLRDSSEFARIAEGTLSALDAASSRGVKQAPFVVLMGVQMPASLVEIGFLSNADEERALRSGARRDKIARALARAVIEFGRRYDARRGVERDGAHQGAGG